MSTGQPGIFAQGSRSHFVLELDMHPGASAADVLTALRRLREPAVTSGGANVVTAFGPELWRRVAPDGAPPGLEPFRPIEGPMGRRAPIRFIDGCVRPRPYG